MLAIGLVLVLCEPTSQSSGSSDPLSQSVQLRRKVGELCFFFGFFDLLSGRRGELLPCVKPIEGL